MNRKGLRITAAAALFACLLLGSMLITPSARAAIATSNITTPTDPTFLSAALDPNTGRATGTFAIAGTTTGSMPGDMVDILCYYANTYTTVTTGVTLNPDGSFSDPTAPLDPIWETPGGICRLAAVPAGTTPATPTGFTGPRIAVDGHEEYSVNDSGPNDGTQYDYYLWGGQLTAAFDYDSLGSCGVEDGYLFDPTFAVTTYTFDCAAALYQGESMTPTRSELQIDGSNAYSTAQATYIDPDATGLPALSFSYSVDPSTGDLVIHETDPLVKCTDPTYPPTTASCATFVSAGVTDNRTITQNTDGHISWVTDVFTSTDGQAHSLDLLWDNGQRFWSSGGDSTQLEYEFPGQSSYSMHAVNDTVSLPTSPGTIFVRMHGAADGDTATGQGAIVYDRPATGATFTNVQSDVSEFTLHQTGTVPAGGSTRFRFAYVQDYLAAKVAADAQTAATAFLNPVTVTKAGAGSGTVTSSPAGVNCGSTCTSSYAYGTSVTLTATPSTGSTFAGWSGACTGTSTCTVTTNDTSAVTATFDVSPETLTITRTGDGKGTVSSTPSGISCGATCSTSFPYGTSVTLTAQAASGSSFTGWSGTCSGKSNCTIPLTAASAVSANFVRNCVVPNLKNKTLKKAKKALKHADCRLGKVKKATSKKVKKGRVISQKPKAHKHLKHDAKVSVVLSKGKRR